MCRNRLVGRKNKMKKLIAWIVVGTIALYVLSKVLPIIFLISAIALGYYGVKWHKKTFEQQHKKPAIIALAVALISSMLIVALDTDDDKEEQTQIIESTNVAETTEVEEVPKEIEETEEIKEKESPEEPEQPNDEVDDETIQKINEQIKKHLDETKGFALGTLDRDGKPTENGEGNPEFAWALYVYELTYDGDNAFMQTDAGFLDLTEEERTRVANSAQSIAKLFVGQEEDWDYTDHQRGIFLTIQNGDIPIGHSKATQLNEFKWHD